MANHKSALKAHRRSLERRDRNRSYRSRMRRALRSTRAAMDAAGAEGATDALREQFRSTVSLIDRLAGKGIIHVNTASRYKARLTRRLAGIQP